MWRGSINLGGHSFNLLKLLHQVKLGMQSAGGINNYLLNLAVAGCLQSIKDHCPRVGTRLMSHHLHPGRFSQALELVNRRCSKGISRRQYNPPPRLF